MIGVWVMVSYDQVRIDSNRNTTRQSVFTLGSYDLSVKVLFNPSRYPAIESILHDGKDAEPSLVDDVYDRILLRIITGDLKGGSELKSTRLATELQVSRTPVIQALARLSADGIVVQPRHQRATVRPNAENWLVDIHQVRQLVEPQAAAQAAGNIPTDVISDLTMLAREAHPTKLHEWQSAARHFDYALHLTIAEFCGNLAMRSAIRRCWDYKRISYQVGGDSDRGLRQGFREHEAILAALEAGDSASASEAVRSHLESAAKHRPRTHIV